MHSFDEFRTRFGFDIKEKLPSKTAFYSPLLRDTADKNADNIYEARLACPGWMMLVL